ncbi:hypothetical protein EJB05_30595 [Eragrostis curvula]|uniref:Uncharacterized protein n=1 Tax=Eragrostis curvula TaxID=38414 RepID=A0A5J9UC97_9POAL|nr:hypothetical protein EJB05_30595 [Eragrostis curvula]
MVGHGGGGGGSEAAAMSPATGGSGGKRGRGLEEDVYVDNLNSHKRYLSEVMASSMNGLSVGDSVADNTMGSPVRLENASCFRDETVMQYPPTSEESEDYRPCDSQVNTSGNQTDKTSRLSSPTSSPNRSQKLNTWFCSGNPYPLPSCSLSAAAAANVRHTEHEGRIPSSPNDMCHGGDLRRTALLRSVQMRVQGPQSSVLLFSTELDGEQERAHVHADEHEHNKKKNLEGVELERRSCPNSIQDARFGQHPEGEENIVEECRTDYGATSAIFNRDDISSKLCVDVDERSGVTSKQRLMLL